MTVHGFTINGLECLQTLMKAGHALVVVPAFCDPPEAVHRMGSGILYVVDATPAVTGIPREELIPAMVEQWINAMLVPAVRGAKEPDVRVVTRWGEVP